MEHLYCCRAYAICSPYKEDALDHSAYRIVCIELFHHEPETTITLPFTLLNSSEFAVNCAIGVNELAALQANYSVHRCY